MRRTARTARTATVTALCAAALTLAPTAAHAASDPTPGTYAVEWSSSDLLSVAADGTGTVVAANAGPVSVTGFDVDETGAGYAIRWDSDALYAVDISGASSQAAAITDGSATYTFCTALDYTDGVIWIACNISGNRSAVGTVDPTTGLFTITALTLSPLSSLATDPVSGVLYGFGHDGSVQSIVGADVTVVADPTRTSIWAADFAADGTLWVAVGATATLTTLGAWTPVVINTGLADQFYESLTVVSAPAAPAAPTAPTAPELASTGLNGTGASIALGAAAVIVVGGLLLVIRRRAARSHD
ncbi:hypothetical protein [Salinibacterium sp. ZJ70]|uniref:hypothetical protein n=1 Tax=Salinibacterium sp. ZJ70 TaxID=2708084 RepID=UPI00142071A6|nr:hypothetical protein [Salinibacterium sp. ZJ70]